VAIGSGEAWKKHGVTHDKVVARNQHTAEGFKAMWAYAARMLDEAAAKGALISTPQ
jgi:putative hydrolase of HD superfamily